ncbi:unnamed protein product [Gongylonema pulchrum]|uniref:Secreted protein n=1 Tax=Gongylonema pulchrum TaxID=637853 RepID=A0A183E404_9BILA|nr:unnamed protein product [Gongylonema pulchrum]
MMVLPGLSSARLLLLLPPTPPSLLIIEQLRLLATHWRSSKAVAIAAAIAYTKPILRSVHLLAYLCNS